MLEFLRKHASVFLLLFAVWGAWFLGKQTGTNEENLRWQQEVHDVYVKKSQAATEQHNAVQTALDEIGKKHAEDMAGLEGSTDGIIAGLELDNKRLRVKLKGSPSGTGDGSGQCIATTAGKAELDPETGKALVGLTQEADRWIENLQNTVRVLQDRLNDKEGQ